MKWILIGLLSLYRKRLSPYLGGGCRFQPSCSDYALQCIRRFGAIRGSRLALHRFLRCESTQPMGMDPVPTVDRIGAAMRGDLVEETGEGAVPAE